MEEIGIGMLGCGRIADLQCLGYLEHPRAKIVAVCDRDEDLARRRAEEWGAHESYTDLERMLADPEVDAVEILTPHHLHEAHAVAALEAGKHVSLQKPPTRTLEEFERVARAAEESGRVFRVFENFMHYPPHVRAKQLIEEGAIGGFAAQVLQVLAEADMLDAGLKLRPMMLPDRFIDHDSPATQYHEAGLDAANVVDVALSALGEAGMRPSSSSA